MGRAAPFLSHKLGALRFSLGLLAGLAVAACGAAKAETLREAVDRAVRLNPAVAAKYAGARAAYEGTSQALAGYLPKLLATADAGVGYDRWTDLSGSTWSRTYPRGFGAILSQPLFDGGRTGAQVDEARAKFAGATEAARGASQTLIASVSAAYMSVLRDRQLLAVYSAHLKFDEDQLRLVQAQHAFGETTAQDIAQAQSKLSSARVARSAAESKLAGTEAIYRQLTGNAPQKLSYPAPLERTGARSLDEAISVALKHNPALAVAASQVDNAAAAVRAAESEFLPKMSINATVAQRYGDYSQNAGSMVSEQLAGSVVGRLTFPIFEGGATLAKVREAKEVTGQRRLEEDAARDQIRAAVVTRWSQSEASKVQTRAADEGVRAARSNFVGVQQLYVAGFKTLSDLYDAETDLLGAYVTAISVQTDRVTISFALAEALGILNVDATARRDADPGLQRAFSTLALVVPRPSLALRREIDDCAEDCSAAGLRLSTMQ
jgi:outer membrane protein